MIVESVNMEIISKAITVLVSVFSAYKAFFIIVYQRKERFRLDYAYIYNMQNYDSDGKRDSGINI